MRPIFINHAKEGKFAFMGYWKPKFPKKVAQNDKCGNFSALSGPF